MNNMIEYKIYKLSCSISDKFYIGSTKSKLTDRLKGHVNKKCNTTRSKFLIDPHIELIESINTKDYNMILNREREIIEGYKKTSCNNILNRNIPNRTGPEYYNDNRNNILSYKKEFYKNNKDRLKLNTLMNYYKNHDIDKIKNKKIKELILKKKQDLEQNKII